MQKVVFQDLGLTGFKEAWHYQEKILSKITSVKRDNNGMQPDPLHYLIFCEHPHVYTLGKSGDPANLLIEDSQMDANEANFFKINRGGDITYHGPGQLVGYPILDLDFFFHDIHKYLRYLEDAIILMLKDFNISAGKIDKLTGVWIDPDDNEKARKICAFGVRCSRWVTMHGFALNVNTDLNYFRNIIPCGIEDKAVTSMQNELGVELNIDEVKTSLKQHLSEIFQFELLNVSK